MDYMDKDKFCIGGLYIAGDKFISQKSGLKWYLPYMIYVYGKEGDIPHFHIVKEHIIKESGDFECCACIYEPLYFDHAGKSDRLDIEEREILNEFLKAPAKFNNKMSNWQAIEFLWNYANGTDNESPRQSTKSQQPDYTKMIDSIHKYK